MSKGGAGISTPHWTSEALGQKGPHAPIVFTPHPCTMGVGYAEVLGEAPSTAPRGNTGWAGSLSTRTTVLKELHLRLWARGQNSGPRRRQP